MAFTSPTYAALNHFAIPQQTPVQPSYAGPQSYVNIQAPNAYNQNQNGIITRYVSSEAEATQAPNPINGCAFYIDGDAMVLYVKYADGRSMETYDLKIRDIPKDNAYVTVDELNELLDKKFEEFGKKFVVKRDRGTTNGQPVS